MDLHLRQKKQVGLIGAFVTQPYESYRGPTSQAQSPLHHRGTVLHYFSSYGTRTRIIPSRLFSRKICPSGPSPKRMSARVAGILPCAVFLSLMT
jgi:hypothetical protein